MVLVAVGWMGPIFFTPAIWLLQKIQGKTSQTHIIVDCSCKTHHTRKLPEETFLNHKFCFSVVSPLPQKKKQRNTRTHEAPSETSQAQRHAKATRCNWPSHPMQNRSGHLGRTCLGVSWRIQPDPQSTPRSPKKKDPCKVYMRHKCLGSSIKDIFLFEYFFSEAASDFFYIIIM